MKTRNKSKYEGFLLDHTILYAKGWYKSTRFDRSIWWDLGVVLEADLGHEYYTTFYRKDFYSSKIRPDENHILRFLLMQAKKIDNEQFQRNLDIEYYLCQIQPEMTQRFGYRHNKSTINENNNEYDINEATAWYLLSCLSMATKKELGFEEFSEPDYTVLPKPISKGITKDEFLDKMSKFVK